MRRFGISGLLVIMLVTIGFAAESKERGSEDSAAPGAIGADLIRKMQESVKPDPQMQRLIDAVIANPVKEIALNNSVLKDHNPYFSHEIKTGSITDQKSSGRCWLFAGLNVLRPAVIAKIDDKSFEFSQNYLFFWDKIEKSNTFLEKVIQRRNLDVRSMEFQRILKDPVGDGGWWEYFVYLVDKYGVVPASAMPETKSTESSGMMDQIITERLREFAADLRAMNDKGASETKLRQKKEEDLLEIYKILTYHLGIPPVEFTFRYKSSLDEEKKTAALIKAINSMAAGKPSDFTETEALKEMAQEKASLYETYTPKSFAEKYVLKDLKDFIVLGNDPSRPFYKRYVIENDRNVFDRDWAGFINVPVEDMKQAAVLGILSDEPLWFGADVGPQRDSKSGIMNAELYKYNDIYGVVSKFTKADRMLYQTEATNHAMVLCGVDLVNDKPLKWKVENSWGTDAGSGGFFTMYDNWFDEYVIQLIVPKKFLPERILKIKDEKPEIIKEWEFIAQNWRMN
jgi:bleomycin hydrolase